MINEPNKAKKIGSKGNKKSKKSVQTTFFKPVIKTEKIVDENITELIELINNIDINLLTPVEAMKIMFNIKEKLKNFTSK